MFFLLRWCWFANLPQHAEGKERPKKETECSRLAGGSWIHQGTCIRGLSRCPQDDWVSTPARLLQIYMEALMRGHAFSPDGFNGTLLSQDRALEMTFWPCEQWVDIIYSKDRGGGGEFNSLGPARVSISFLWPSPTTSFGLDWGEGWNSYRVWNKICGFVLVWR